MPGVCGRLSESTMTFQPSGASGSVSFNTDANYQQARTVGKYPYSWAWMVTKIEYHLDCFFTDDSYHERFYLTNFFNAIENDEDVHVNCDDCANLFCVFLSSIGCTSQTKECAGDIWTRSVYVIGDVDPSIRHFGSHHFGWIENMVYDSSLLLTDIYNNVVYPYNMHINDYQAWLISSGDLTMMSPVTTIIVN